MNVAQKTAGPAPARTLASVGSLSSRGWEKLGDAWITGVLVVLLVAFSIASPDFLTKAAWVATALAATEVILVGVGMAYVLIARGIDLSIGANLGLSAMLSALVMSKLIGTDGTGSTGVILIGLAISLVAGTLVGVLNGLVITRMRINPLIATLGTSGAATGITQLLNGGQQISQIPSGMIDLGTSTWFGGWLPVPALIAIVVVVVLGFILRSTRFGQRTYAIGSNPEAALRTGISVNRHTVGIYALAGGCAGLAGFLVMAQLGAASVTAGQSDTLPAIAAAVIGGVSLFGGRGSVFGAVVGALIITILQTGLVIAKVEASWQVIAVGVVLVLAVFVDQQRIRLATRR